MRFLPQSNRDSFSFHLFILINTFQKEHVKLAHSSSSGHKKMNLSAANSVSYVALGKSTVKRCITSPYSHLMIQTFFFLVDIIFLHRNPLGLMTTQLLKM